VYAGNTSEAYNLTDAVFLEHGFREITRFA